ncbi:MAG: hypothetical protein R3A47_03400 [Polyangiales bacterium]
MKELRDTFVVTLYDVYASIRNRRVLMWAVIACFAAATMSYRTLRFCTNWNRQPPR